MNHSTRPLVDPFGRAITYLRVSVTDRCNFGCTYCMPHNGTTLQPRDNILSYESIAGIVAVASGRGISKIRLTGGEPLVKRDIETCVSLIAHTPGIDEVCMTTNGSLLTYDKARALKHAGLTRITISLNTLDPGRFASIARVPALPAVLRGIDAALEADLRPLKINMIVFNDTTPGEIESLRRFCEAKHALLQTINHFTLTNRCQRHAGFAADRPTPCSLCNRLRLTADGHFKPCLYSDTEVKVDPDRIEDSLEEAVSRRRQTGGSCTNRVMSQIGG
jgi:cyclic pyranopterin phosphate synthase